MAGCCSGRPGLSGDGCYWCNASQESVLIFPGDG